MNEPLKQNLGYEMKGSLDFQGLIDLYFLDARSKIIEVAAFLDRLERAGGGEDDFRIQALKKALRIVSGDGGDKACSVQMAFSDPTTEPLESAAGMKGALGAYREKGES